MLTLVLLFQTADQIGPIVVPLIVMAVTIAIAWGLRLNGSRTATVLGAVATAYAALGSQLSSWTSLPNWLRVVLIVIGIAFTTLNERAQGGASKQNF